MAESASGRGTCRVVVDLRGVPWADDAAEVCRRLAAVAGVLEVDPQPERRQAVVVHDARTSLPALFNFVRDCRTPVRGR